MSGVPDADAIFARRERERKSAVTRAMCATTMLREAIGCAVIVRPCNGCAAWIGYRALNCGYFLCARNYRLNENVAMTPAKKGHGKRCSLIFPPLPLARELKVVREQRRGLRIRIETPPVSWLGEFAPIYRGTPARPSHPAHRESRSIRCAGPVARAEKFPPYSRAAATVFHRLPVRGVSL